MPRGNETCEPKAAFALTKRAAGATRWHTHGRGCSRCWHEAVTSDGHACVMDGHAPFRTIPLYLKGTEANWRLHSFYTLGFGEDLCQFKLLSTLKGAGRDPARMTRICAHEGGSNKVKIKKLIAFERNDLVTCFRVGSE